MSEILCNDCLDTGWIGDREGRSVCACIAETEPYQQLQAEVERLRKAVEDWHDAAVRAERNAAMSQEETLSHIDRIAALMDEVERLRETNEAIKRVTKEWRNDAERYRWLRDHYCAAVKFINLTPEVIVIYDDAIDAAREGE